MPMSLENS
jgi:hypothetical protein